MPMARPTMQASARGELIAARAAKLPLQPVRDFEDAALALDLAQIAFVAAVGHVLAKNQDARVARHLVLQAGVDEVDHGLGLAMKLGWMIELLGGRIDAGRVDVIEHGVGGDEFGLQSVVRRLANFAARLAASISFNSFSP